MNRPFLLLLIALLISGTPSSAQPKDSAARQQLYTYYNLKAKKQSRAALPLFGVGLLISAYSAVHILDAVFGGSNDAAAIGLLAGGSMEIGGLALAFASGRNRKIAKELQATVRMQRYKLLQGISLQTTCYPGLSLTIRL